MKVIVLKNNLKDGLDSVSRSIGENPNLPILKNILISANSNQLKLSSTNLELAITKLIPGKVIEEGVMTIPFNILSSIVSNLTNERINLEKKDRNLIIKTDNYEALIQGANPDDFPIIPKIKNENQPIEINSSIFKESISKVVNAAQISELRPEISGVLLKIEQNTIKLVATDSFRLAEKIISENQFKGSFIGENNIIIPLKTIQEMTRIIKEDVMVGVFIDNNQILFKIDGLEIVSRLIEGKFPDYNPIIPKSIDTEIIINREQFINALKLTSSFATKVNEIKLKAERGSKVIKLYAADTALGESNYLIPSKIKGDGVEVVFNWRYLLDGLRNGDSENVFLGLNGDSRPAVIKTPEDVSYLYILMPIKTA